MLVRIPVSALPAAYDQCAGLGGHHPVLQPLHPFEGHQRRPAWWLLLFVVGVIVPFVGWILLIVFGIIIVIDLARSFAKSSGFAVGLFFLNFVFVPILGFGEARYVGPAAAGSRMI
jgi:hypothetical protein